MSARGIRRAREREASRRGRRAALTATVLSAAAATALIAPAAASAATWQVTELLDNNNFVQDCTPAQCQLRAAIQRANNTPGPDTITFASGLSGEIRLRRLSLRVDGADPLTIIGPGSDVVSISADGDGNGVLEPFYRCDRQDSRVFEFHGTAPGAPQQVSISGLTMTEGIAQVGVPANSSYNDPSRAGGAIISRNTDLTITDSVISNSIATGLGGGISADQLTLENTVVSGNQGLTGGGGIHLTGAGPSELRASTISGNRTGTDTPDVRFGITNPQGGGLSVSGSGGATLEDLEVVGNVARYANAGDGGGAWVDGDVSISSSTFSDNDARRDGGGIAAEAGEILNSTIAGNEAGGNGGGIHASIQSGDTPVAIGSSTITGNYANDGFGGGVHAYSNAASAPYATLASSIVGDNFSADGKDVSADGSHSGAGAIPATFSLIESSQPSIVPPASSNILDEDPDLGPLADNGGSTETMLPDPGSPAIDAGKAGGLALDQRGFARTQDQPAANATGSDATDIGAVELGPDTVAPDTAIDSGPPPNSTAGPYVFQFSSGEGDSTFECSLDGGPFSPCTSPKTYNSLPVGGHSFSVRSTDPSGNVDPSPATHRFTVSRAPVNDTAAPDTVLTKIPKRKLKERGRKAVFTVEFTGSDAVTPTSKLRYECSLNGDPFQSCSSRHLGTVRKGEHTFSVRAVDEAGNRDATPAATTFTKVNRKKRRELRPDGRQQQKKRC
jgi:hypothetical protein